MHNLLYAILAFAGAASVAALSPTALAQQAEPTAPERENSPVIEEIVVTAQKRTEDVQNVPIAMSVMTGEQLGAQGIRRAEDLGIGVPNLQISQPLGQGLPVFSLRGVSMSDYSLSQNGPIAVYYDEVYKGNWAIMGVGFFDLERVEVLKGPQGTLYGKNTTGRDQPHRAQAAVRNRRQPVRWLRQLRSLQRRGCARGGAQRDARCARRLHDGSRGRYGGERIPRRA